MKRTKNINTKKRNTRQRNTRRRNTRRRNTKKAKNKQRKTKRSMRGGVGESRCLDCSVEKQPVLQGVSLLNKFFKEDTTVKTAICTDSAYKLNGDLQAIMAHGSVLPTYTVVPDGIILYFLVEAGKKDYGYAESEIETYDNRGENDYIRVYMPGSLIQEHTLNFYPFTIMNTQDLIDSMGKRKRGTGEAGLLYAPMGFLKYKLKTGNRDCTGGFTCGIEEAENRAMLYLRGCIRSRKRLQQFDEILDFITLRNYVEVHLDTFYDDNLDEIYEKKDLFFNGSQFFPRILAENPFTLSKALNRIAEVMKTDDSISGDWFCHFCRVGEALNIETLNACQTKYFESLPREFFDEKIHFEGVSDELRRESSLASKSETANFKMTVDVLQRECQKFLEIPGLLCWRHFTSAAAATSEIKSKLNDIHTRLNNGTPVSLEPSEVCFIFQLKNHLQKLQKKGIKVNL